MFHHLELEWMYWIHQFRHPWLDQFFKTLDFFDRQEFFFLLIPLIWLGRGWKTGLKLFYLLFLSYVLNHALKDLFASPRPFHVDPTIGIIQVKGWGFPSGAAQTAILLSGLLVSRWQSSWKWVLALTYVSFISFSRVYLGVHFPSDILGGWLAGWGLWVMCAYSLPFLEKRMETLKPITLLLLSQIAPLLLLMGHYSTSTLHICCLASGIGMGLFIHHFFQLGLPSPQSVKEYVLRAVIAVTGIFLGYTLIMQFSSLLIILPLFFCIGLWLSLGDSLIGHKLVLHPEIIK